MSGAVDDQRPEIRGFWVPYWAWFSRNLTLTERLFLAHIHNYDNPERGCWMSNAKIGEFFGISAKSASNVISSLAKAGLVTVEVTRDASGEVVSRSIRVNHDGIAKGGHNTPPPPDLPGDPYPSSVDTPPPDAGADLPLKSGTTHNIADLKDDLKDSGTKLGTTPSTVHGTSRKRAAPDRGTRLPADWTPGDAGARFARDLRLDPKAVFEQFRDYWNATPGAKGRKADWPATWRNWCRSQAQRNGGRQSTFLGRGEIDPDQRSAL